jgi:hypothetical protein
MRRGIKMEEGSKRVSDIERQGRKVKGEGRNPVQ